MSEKKVTRKQIEDLLSRATITTETVYDNLTVMHCRLETGFVITETSGAVDKENYDLEAGKKTCLRHIRDRLWALEGYALAKSLKEDECLVAADRWRRTEHMDFGDALHAMGRGLPVCRAGWNGRGIYLRLMPPTDGAHLTQPYIYINTMELQSENTDVTRGRVPWVASQTDLLARDWRIYERVSSDAVT